MLAPIQDGKKKFGLMMELEDLAERAFVHKLKRKNPQVTPIETEAAVRAWYQHRLAPISAEPNVHQPQRDQYPLESQSAGPNVPPF
jgi:hypothetical protein